MFVILLRVKPRKLSAMKNPSVATKVEMMMEIQVMAPVMNHHVTPNISETVMKILRPPETIPVTAEKKELLGRALPSGSDKGASRLGLAFCTAVCSLISTMQLILIKPYPWFLVIAP